MTSTTITNDAEPTHPLVVVNLSGILKLTSTNYLSWKLQLEATLFGYGLSKFLDGTHPQPEPTVTTTSETSTTTTPNPKYLTWKRQDQLLFGALIGTLDPTIVPLVARASNSKDAWDTLANTYARHSRGHLKLLKTKFKNLTKGNLSISEYINAVRVCVNQRLVLGDTVLPEDIIEQVCDGIKDPAYAAIINGVSARDSLISFEELHEKLLVCENSICQDTPSPTLPVTVHNTSTRPYRSPASTPAPTA